MPTEAPGHGAGLDTWLAWQEALHPADIDLGLERVAAVATRLDLFRSPPVTIAVGGTNGKGSAAYLLDGALRAAGHRCGRYVSPHLLHYGERIAVDGRPAGDAELVRSFRAVEAARADVPLTFFEFGTLAALWCFRQRDVEVQVLEVGLGGRLDAVNVLDADVAIVVQVGTDHADWLGAGRESVGREKAGIFRAGRAAVCGDPDPPDSLLEVAARSGADLWLRGRDFDWGPAGDAWSWRGRGRRLRKLPIPQDMAAPARDNAAAVLAALDALGARCPVDEAAIRSALAQWRVPGRFERRGDLLLDVAHNIEAATALAASLPGPEPLPIVLGMLADKPVEAVARALAGCASVFHCAGLSHPRGLDGEALARRVQGAGPAVLAHAGVAEAIESARRGGPGCGTIVVTGSFLTVGEAMTLDGR